jgi:hypothetical protein
MSRLPGRLLMMVVLALYGAGLPQFAHRAIEHGLGEAACCAADSHTHDGAPSEGDSHSADDCPTCQMLGGNLAIGAPAPALIGQVLPPVTPAAAPSATIQFCIPRSTLGPRGPPARAA